MIIRKHHRTWALAFAIFCLVFLVKIGKRSELIIYQEASKKCQSSSLYPYTGIDDDRIVQQLSYKANSSSLNQTFNILIWGGVRSWGGIQPHNGDEVFAREQCHLQNCVLSSNQSELSTVSDLVIFRDRDATPDVKLKPNGQVWMMYLLESPHNVNVKWDNIDWTATYRRDSTIVAPYGKWSPASQNFPNDETIDLEPIARNKTKKVAWFVSNCKARNNRLEYAMELAKYIEVDIFGSCGDKKCPRNSGEECLKMLREEYKFYLAFENSNCADYVTEKFWVSALRNDIVPIVMGPSVEDYQAVAPPGSFIHVDQFSSPKELAKFLNRLDANDDLYQEYFSWKDKGDFVKTKFFCRVCALLNYKYLHPEERIEEKDLREWWKGSDVCRK